MKVTLTFDNGPTPGVTEDVLDVLRQHDLRAIFFVVGSNLRDPAEVVRQIDEAQDLLDNLGVADPDRLFRPNGDGGFIDDRLLGPDGVEHLRRRGYTCVLWNVVPGDWRDPEGWVDQAMAQVTKLDWSVVVLHDLSVGALPRLPELLDRLEALDAEPTADLPESCVPIRKGRPTSSYHVLAADGG